LEGDVSVSVFLDEQYLILFMALFMNSTRGIIHMNSKTYLGEGKKILG